MNKKADDFWINTMEFGRMLGCHQMPERSFSFRGYQFPICARCTGVVMGELFSIGLILRSTRLKVIFIPILLATMGVDWLLQEKEILVSTNSRRLITGICGGVGMTYAYYYLFRFFYGRSRI